MMNQDNENPSEKEPNPLDVMKSVGAAMIGVQSQKNRERDFKKGKASHFIIAGIIFTIIFILTLVTIVSNVLK